LPHLARDSQRVPRAAKAAGVQNAAVFAGGL
jgi:hypothetical protein